MPDYGSISGIKPLLRKSSRISVSPGGRPIIALCRHMRMGTCTGVWDFNKKLLVKKQDKGLRMNKFPVVGELFCFLKVL